MPPKGDKVMRMHEHTAVIEAGAVLLSSDAPWLDDFLAELMVFPGGRHDDQADALSQALGWLKDKTANTGSVTDLLDKLSLLHKGKMPGALKMRSLLRHEGLIKALWLKDYLYLVALEDVDEFIAKGWMVMNQDDADPIAMDTYRRTWGAARTTPIVFMT